MKCNLTLLAVLAIAAMSGAVHAQQSPVPSEINYQGTLLRLDGITPENGPVDLDIRLYAEKDDVTANALWGESHASVELFDGIFNILLGSGQAIVAGPPHVSLDTVFTQAALWIGLTVAGEAAERPERRQFASAPYALTANTAINAVHGAPVGSIALWGKAETVPEDAGWLPCDGRTLNGTADSGKYQALWKAIGITWGGAGETSFKIPDFGGRALMAENATSAGQNDNNSLEGPPNAGLTTHTLGDFLGAEKQFLQARNMQDHKHTYTDEYSMREVNVFRVSALSTTPTTADLHFPSDEAFGFSGEPTLDTGESEPHQNMQPSRVVTFIIKY